MPSVYEFDTQTVRDWRDPRPITEKVIQFSHPFVATPRTPHGFRELDVSYSSDVRVKSTIMHSNNDSVDCRIENWAGTISASTVDSILALAPADVDFLTGEYMRTPSTPSSTRISFKRPFVTPPRVIVFFNHIDLAKGHNWRLRASADAIDTRGFTLSVETWDDTVLNAAQACWIAYPEDRGHIFSTSVQAKISPQLQHSEAITFGDATFLDNPSVFVALNYFDIDCKAGFRLNAYADNVSRTGLTFHLDTWADTVVYGAGASIIALTK